MTFDPYVRNAIKQAEGRRREFYLFVSVLIDNVVDVRIVVDLLVVIDHTFHTGMLFLPVDLDLLAKPARRGPLSLGRGARGIGLKTLSSLSAMSTRP